jgi:hypothetical protein
MVLCIGRCRLATELPCVIVMSSSPYRISISDRAEVDGDPRDSRGPRKIVIACQVPRIFSRMIPFCSRFDSVLFTSKRSAIASYGNFSSPLNTDALNRSANPACNRPE